MGQLIPPGLKTWDSVVLGEWKKRGLWVGPPALKRAQTRLSEITLRGTEFGSTLPCRKTRASAKAPAIVRSWNVPRNQSASLL